ncbi:hypothetical protein B484DRAFT_1280 [Ochromonadaceae sp. CCMP2298]|nr:hypothetical protein B484DRAFT_1280 [Ochromonadaceae sp. CCMP2298]
MRVVVVGAGSAGLGAAAVLREAGVEVVLLEARDRTGGRVHRQRMHRNLLKQSHNHKDNHNHSHSVCDHASVGDGGSSGTESIEKGESETETGTETEGDGDLFVEVSMGANWIHGLLPSNPMYATAVAMGLQLLPTSTDDEPGDDVLLFDWGGRGGGGGSGGSGGGVSSGDGGDSGDSGEGGDSGGGSELVSASEYAAAVRRFEFMQEHVWEAAMAAQRGQGQGHWQGQEQGQLQGIGQVQGMGQGQGMGHGGLLLGSSLQQAFAAALAASETLLAPTVPALGNSDSESESESASVTGSGSGSASASDSDSSDWGHFGPCPPAQRRILRWMQDRVGISTAAPVGRAALHCYAEGDSDGQDGK